MTYLGYADDTAIAIGDQHEKYALEHVFQVFEQASGNQIKACKSYTMWLGDWVSSDIIIYEVPPLKRGDTERYLGIQIGHDLAKID